MGSSSGAVRITSPFGLEVAKGRIAGVSSIHKFGQNPQIDNTEEWDIWDGGDGADYTFSSSGVIHYISSSNAGDTQTYDVIGLDENYLEQTISVTAVGQTKTQIGTGEKFRRIVRIKNTGSTDNAGVVYVYEDDTVTAGVPDTATKIRGQIQIGNNQTLMAIYTIPAGKTGYLSSWNCNLGFKSRYLQISIHLSLGAY